MLKQLNLRKQGKAEGNKALSDRIGQQAKAFHISVYTTER